MTFLLWYYMGLQIIALILLVAILRIILKGMLFNPKSIFLTQTQRKESAR